jgi:hypothetical protein
MQYREMTVLDESILLMTFCCVGEISPEDLQFVSVHDHSVLYCPRKPTFLGLETCHN